MRNEQQEQRNKSRREVMRCDLQKALQWCRETKKTINNQLHQPAAVISDSNADLFKVQAGNGEMPMDNKNDCGAQQG